MLKKHFKTSLSTLLISLLFASCATTPKVNHQNREESIRVTNSQKCTAKTCQSTIVLPQTINKHKWRSTL